MKSTDRMVLKVAEALIKAQNADNYDLIKQAEAAIGAMSEADHARRIWRWLQVQANSENDQKAKDAFIEAANAALAIIEGRA